jgi:Big-like domain-containing protein
MSWRLTIGVALVLLAPVPWLVGCSNHGITQPQQPQNDSVIVSAPVQPPPQASGPRGASTQQLTGADSLVYVSLLPGMIPHGSSVRIEDHTGIGLFQGSLTNGGLNPVSVRASVGDVLIIVTTDSVGITRTIDSPVVGRRPVTLVRTEPGRSRTDIPVNAAIVAVFSEPLAPGTVTSSTVKLLQGTQVVAVVPVLAPDGFEVGLQPAGGLAPLTQYQLVVTTGITNTLGTPLDQESQVAFTTGSQPGTLASLSVSPQFAFVLVGGTLQLTAEPKDAAGNTLAGTVSWAWKDTAFIASVSQSGLVTGLARGGPGMVTAAFGGDTADAFITVVPPTSVSIAGTWDWTELIQDSGGFTCADTGTYVFSQVGEGFAGTNQQVGSCTGPSGTVDNSGSYPVRVGTVGGSASLGAMSFGSGPQGCEYSAQFSGTLPTALSGAPSGCFGSSAPAGTWHAVRRP